MSGPSAPAQPSQPPSPQYAPQVLYQAPAPATDAAAIASFVTALCGLGLIPVVLGHLALGRIRRTGAGGTVLAVVGLVLGYTTLALGIVLLLVLGGAIWWGISA